MADDNQTGQPIDIATLPLRNLAATDNLFAIDPATMTGYRIPISIASQSTPGFVIVSGTIPSDYTNSTLVPTFQSLKDVIGSSTGAVRYDTAQGLTPQQQQTALTNIGAEASGALRANVAAEVTADWKFSGLLQVLSAPVNPTDVARKQEVDSKFDKSAGEALQTTVGQIPSTYLTKTDAASTYSTKNDLASVRSIAEAAQTSQQVDDKITSHNQSMSAHANLLSGYATSADLSEVRTIAEAAQTSEQVQASIGNHNVSTSAHSNQFSLMATKSELTTGLAGKLDKTTADGLYVGKGTSYEDVYDSGYISDAVTVPTVQQANSTLIPTVGALRKVYDQSAADTTSFISFHNTSQEAHENRFSLMATAESLAAVKATADAAVQPVQMTNAIATHNAATDAHSNLLNPINASLSGKMDTTAAQAAFIAKGGSLADLYDSGKYSASVAVVPTAQKTSTVIPTVGALRTTMEAFQTDYQNQLSAHNTSMSAHANLVADLATKDELDTGLSTKLDIVTADNNFATKEALQAVQATAEYATTPEEVQLMIDSSGSGDSAYEKVRLTLIPEHNADSAAHSNQFGPINTALAAKIDKSAADAAYQAKGSYLTTDAAKDSYVPTASLMLDGGNFGNSTDAVPRVYQVDDYVNKTVIPSVTSSMSTLMDNKVAAHNSSAEAHSQLLSSYVLTSALTPQLATKLDITTAAATYATQTSLSQGLDSKIDSTTAYSAFAGKSDLNAYVNWANVFSSFGGDRSVTDATSLLPSLKYLDDGLSDMKSYVDQKIPSDPALTKDEAWSMITGTAIPAHNTAADSHANLLNPITTALAGKMDTASAQAAFIAKGGALADLYDAGKYSTRTDSPGVDEATSTVIPATARIYAMGNACILQAQEYVANHDKAANAHENRFSLYQTIAGMSSYQTVAGMSSYLLKTEASSTYQTLSGMSAYQTVAGMSVYLTSADAASAYQPKGSYLIMTATGSASEYVPKVELINSGVIDADSPRAFTAVPSVRGVADMISLIPSSVLETDLGVPYQDGRVTNLWNQESIDMSYIPSTRAVQAALQGYQTLSGMSAYQTVSGMSAYQTIASMSSYQTVAGMSVYLKTADASDAYQPKGDYMLTSSADAKYVPLTRILSGVGIVSDSSQLVTAEQVRSWGLGSVIPSASAYFLAHQVAPIANNKLDTSTLIPWGHQVRNYCDVNIGATLVPELIAAHNVSSDAHANIISTLATKTELSNGLAGKLDASTAMDTYATQAALQAVKMTADSAVQPSQMSSSISSAVSTHNTTASSHGLDSFHAAFDNILESYIPYVNQHITDSITSAQVDSKIAGHNTSAEAHANLIGPINTSLTAKLDKTTAASTYQTLAGMTAYQKASDMMYYIDMSWLVGGVISEEQWNTTYVPCTNQLNNWINASIVPSIFDTIQRTTVPVAISYHNTDPVAHNELFTQMMPREEMSNFLLTADAAATYQPKGDYMLASQASNFLPISRVGDSTMDMWRDENANKVPVASAVMVWYDSSLIPAIDAKVNSGITTHNNSASSHANQFALYAKQADVNVALGQKLDITTAASTYQPKGNYAERAKMDYAEWDQSYIEVVNNLSNEPSDSTAVPTVYGVQSWALSVIPASSEFANGVWSIGSGTLIPEHNADASAHASLFNAKLSKVQADASYQPKGNYFTLTDVDSGAAYADAKFAKTYPYTSGSVFETLIPSVKYVDGMIAAKNYVTAVDVSTGLPIDQNRLDLIGTWNWENGTENTSTIPTARAIASYVKQTSQFPSFFWVSRMYDTVIPPQEGGSLIPTADAILHLLVDMIGDPLSGDKLHGVYGASGGWSYIPSSILTQNVPATMVPSTNYMVNTVHEMCQYWGSGERVSGVNADGGILLDGLVSWYDLSSIVTGTSLTFDTSNVASWNASYPSDKRVFTWKLWLPMPTLKTLVWPSNLKWLDGSAPTFEAGKAYCIALQYDLGGVLNGNVAYSRAI